MIWSLWLGSCSVRAAAKETLRGDGVASGVVGGRGGLLWAAWAAASVSHAQPRHSDGGREHVWCGQGSGHLPPDL